MTGVQFVRLQIWTEIFRPHKNSLGLQKSTANQIRLKEMVVLDMWQPVMCFDHLEKQPWKAGFRQIGQDWNFITEITIGKSICCCILVWAHYWSRNGRNNVLIGLPDLAKESYRKLWQIEDYQIFNIPYLFCQRETFYFFCTNLKLISELVSCDKTVFLCINAPQVWRILINITIFLVHAQLQNSVNIGITRFFMH